MNKQPLKALWLGVMLGLLAATSPTWLSPNYHPHANYDAPWLYPAETTR
jgi:hypothetical protein